MAAENPEVCHEDPELQKVLTPLIKKTQLQAPLQQSSSLKPGDRAFWSHEKEYWKDGNFRGYRGGLSGQIVSISADGKMAQFAVDGLGGDGGSTTYHAGSSSGIRISETPRKIGGQVFDVPVSALIGSSNSVMIPQKVGGQLRLGAEKFRPGTRVLVLGNSTGHDLTTLVEAFGNDGKQVVFLKNSVDVKPRTLKPDERILMPKKKLILNGNPARPVVLAPGSRLRDATIVSIHDDPVSNTAYVVLKSPIDTLEKVYSLDRLRREFGLP